MNLARAALFAMPLALIACAADEPIGPNPGEPAPPSCADDPSTCWRGVHGTARLGDGWPSMPVNLGSGLIFYSVNLVEKQRGYFYADLNHTSPPLEIGNVGPNPCGVAVDNPGYEGPTSVRQLALLSNVAYEDRGVMFGTEDSECYRGLLTYRQGDRYGVVRFIHINDDASVDIEYWIGDPGVEDFRTAPELPR